MIHKHLTLLMAFLIAIALFAGTASQSYAQQLPPRPSPTATPEPEREEEEIVVPARITGTLIDVRTGAPTAGITVMVGDKLVQTDANGNYDRSDLLPGTYQVILNLAAGQGEALQGPMSIEIASGQTVVQHLSFRSPEPIAAPVAEVAVPIALPSTGGTDLASPGLIIGVLLLGTGYLLRRRHNS
jgi:LPXTG-motif cell wall-anchored protein